MIKQKEMRHYGGRKGLTVMHLYGLGPLKMNYVNPADDPANKRHVE
jgi:hypothetical protein